MAQLGASHSRGGAWEREAARIRMETIGSLGALALLAGPANVLMQLSQLPVGYGVAKSVVESGRADRHPIKRARTTFTYLAVAWCGTEAEREAYKKAVNRSHARVNDTHVEKATGEASPVKYNAFDPELQLWVAACLCKGSLDVLRFTCPGLARGEQERIVRSAHTLGTTLQVAEEEWPASLEEFEAYWAREVRERVQLDDTVREYLDDLVWLRPFPALRWTLGWANFFFTAGFLPPEFRAEMRYAWRPWQDLLFRAAMVSLGFAHRLLPRSMRRFPFNFYLWDLRRRMRLGKPLV
ncbi:MAG: oxygenase MpaB family protein [Segniliparus sp.]|uniref:oxygenase MpaB family protein n=1 Tax=Segniliparus sp. TaxID=2804064 RepID=UPI003F2C8E74